MLHVAILTQVIGKTECQPQAQKFEIMDNGNIKSYAV